jgi:hypothetical protein
MNHVPKVGERVECPPRFTGVGIVEAVKVLRYMARVKWPSGVVGWLPLEELQSPVAEEVESGQ